MNFIQRLLSAYLRFMRGRYMKLDSINISLLFLYLLLGILGIFLRNPPALRIIMMVMAIAFVYRYFSKRIEVRQKENQMWMQVLSKLHIDQLASKLSTGLRRTYGRRNSAKNDPAHVYFSCPYCKKYLRVPRNAGTIMVTCPICRNQFKKKT